MKRGTRIKGLLPVWGITQKRAILCPEERHTGGLNIQPEQRTRHQEGANYVTGQKPKQNTSKQSMRTRKCAPSCFGQFRGEIRDPHYIAYSGFQYPEVSTRTAFQIQPQTCSDSKQCPLGITTRTTCMQCQFFF